MIVQCTSCRARFRVSDDKVPDKGVKVRCTKCSNIFKVTRAEAVDAAPARPAAIDAFGLDPEPAAGRRNQAFDLGEPTPPPASPSFAGFDAPPPPGGPARVVPNLPHPVSLTYGAATAGQPIGLDYDLGIGPPPAGRPSPARSAPARPPPPRPPPPGPGSAIDAALDAALASGDPFADLGDLGAPPLPHRPAPAPPRAASPRPALIPAPLDDPFADADFGLGAALAPSPTGHLHEDDDPFAVAMPPEPAPSRTPPPPAVFGHDDPFASTASTDESDPFESASASPQAFSDAASSTSGDARPGPLSSDGRPAPSETGAGSTREFDFGEASLGGKLDLDIASPGIDRPSRGPGPGLELAHLGLVPKGEADDKLKASGVDPKTASRQRVRRELASALFNVLSASVIALAGLVTIASLRSPRPLTPDDLGFPMVWLALGFDDSQPAELLRTTRLLTGTYVTRAGTELFYVQGFAENASSAARESLHVAVEVTRGDRILGRAESAVTLDAGPEQLFALDSRRNDDLQRQLAEKTLLTALRVEPRGRAPFIAVFPLGVEEAEGTDVRLTIRDGVPPTLRGSFRQPTPPTPPPPPPPVVDLSFIGPPAPPPTPAAPEPAAEGGPVIPTSP